MQLEYYTPIYKTIKDGYISSIDERGLEEGHWFGGFEEVGGRGGKLKQIPVSKTQLLREKKRLEKHGYTITLIEMCWYKVEQGDAECVDAFKRDTIFVK